MPTYGPPPVIQKRPARPVKLEPVRVVEQPPVPPEFLDALKNVTVDEGSRVTLEGQNTLNLITVSHE